MTMAALTFGRKSGFSLGTLTLAKGGASGPYPAPAGYRWDYVTENNVRVTERGEYLVALKRVA
jgi:hypothetical protein